MTNQHQNRKAGLNWARSFGVFLIVATLGSAAWAEDRESIPTWEQRAIDGDAAIAEWFSGVAEFMDLFIAGRHVTNQPNLSNIRIENTSNWVEGVGYNNSTAFRLNLRLPNVEEYWNLKFTSYNEEEESRNTQNAQYQQLAHTRNYGAAIGWFKQLGNIRAAFQPRVELRNPLFVEHTLTLDTTLRFTERAAFLPKVQLFAGSDRGTGVYDQMNFNFQVSKIYGMSLVNQSNYEDKTHIFTVAQGVAFSRRVTRTGAIAYSLFFNSDNQAAYHLSGYALATTWSQTIYRNMLDYSVTPHWDFTKDHDFTGHTGISFTIALQF